MSRPSEVGEHRGFRQAQPASVDKLNLVVSRRWIEARPLLRTDLISEPEDMAGLGIAFKPFVV